MMNNHKLFITMLNDPNTTIQYNSSGSYGITFLIVNNGTFGIPKKVFLKLTFINPEYLSIFQDFTTVKEYAFINEIEIQKELYEISKKYNHQICPELFYSSIASDNINELTTIIFNKTREDNENSLVEELLEEVKQTKITHKKFSVGIILMEYLDNYLPASRLRTKLVMKSKQSTNKQPIIDEYVNYLAYIKSHIILLTLMGYHHHDFHLNNIMYKENNDKTISIMLIDFGLAQRLNNITFSNYLLLIKEKKYEELLKKLVKYGDTPKHGEKNRMYIKKKGESGMHIIKNRGMYTYLISETNKGISGDVPMYTHKKMNEKIDYILNHKLSDIYTGLLKNIRKHNKMTEPFKLQLTPIREESHTPSPPIKKNDEIAELESPMPNFILNQLIKNEKKSLTPSPSPTPKKVIKLVVKPKLTGPSVRPKSTKNTQNKKTNHAKKTNQVKKTNQAKKTMKLTGPEVRPKTTTKKRWK
jgi:hypothetical protein